MIDLNFCSIDYENREVQTGLELTREISGAVVFYFGTLKPNTSNLFLEKTRYIK